MRNRTIPRLIVLLLALLALGSVSAFIAGIAASTVLAELGATWAIFPVTLLLMYAIAYALSRVFHFWN